MEQTTDPFKEAIASYLQTLALSDELFAKTLNKSNKNINDCVTYILNEVKKSKRVGFEDDEIFKMAIHYYDEDSIEVSKPLPSRVVINKPIAATQQTEKTTIKSSTKVTDINQTSLFHI